jgi:hypothetical protein
MGYSIYRIFVYTPVEIKIFLSKEIFLDNNAKFPTLFAPIDIFIYKLKNNTKVYKISNERGHTEIEKSVYFAYPLSYLQNDLSVLQIQ